MLIMAYVRQFGFPAVFVRATNVYGAHQQLFKIIPRAVIRIRDRRRIELHGGGGAVKSYIHVRDISRGELAIMTRGTIGGIYHLSPDGGISVHDLVALICRLTGASFDECVAMVAERPGQDAAYVIDSSRARTELGWQPVVTLEDGLREVIAWIDANWDEISRLEQEYVHRP
jgi:dTDP-glucose 4,6-dehydratase